MTEFLELSEEPVPGPEKEDPAEGLAPPPESEKETIAQPEASGEPTEVEVAVKLSQVKLSQPSKELATRLLSTVSFKERIYGLKDHPGPGPEPLAIYNFEEASRFLEVEDDHLVGWDGGVSSIDLHILKKWVGETLGDKELAQVIGEMAKKSDNYTGSPYDRYLKRLALIRPVKGLMEQRVKQCKEIIGEET